MEIEKFNHNNEEYEVRIEFDGETVFIQAFKNNHPVNSSRYNASLGMIQDTDRYLETDVVKDLIDAAKQEVIKGNG